MKDEILHTLMKHSLMICADNELSDRVRLVKEEIVKLLCIICTVKTNKFYIPGETKLVERLRK